MAKPYVSQEAIENLPKKPQNGFMIFRADNYDTLKAKNSEKTMTEITKMIGELWSDLDDKRKNVHFIFLMYSKGVLKESREREK